MVSYKEVSRDFLDYLEENGYEDYEVSDCYDNITIYDEDKLDDLKTVIEEYEYNFDSSKNNLDIQADKYHEYIKVSLTILETRKKIIV